MITLGNHFPFSPMQSNSDGNMSFEFLGRAKYQTVLHRQQQWDSTSGSILGFEPEPVVTLGVRARGDQDLPFGSDKLKELGYSVLPVDRGGQATLHNPGQLVIFPVWPIREFGVRRWVEGLAEITRDCLANWGIVSEWDHARPGLYTSQGKIMACGVRIRRGMSTHGVAINVRNELADFALIRACGHSQMPMDKMAAHVPDIQLREVFSRWMEEFVKRF